MFKDKETKRAYDRLYHARRSPEAKALKIEKQKKRLRDTKKVIFEYLLQHPCVDCGEADPIVLEFDHVKGEKHMEISNMTRCGCSISTIMDEVSKCEVRCANCHKRKTSKQFNWYVTTL